MQEAFAKFRQTGDMQTLEHLLAKGILVNDWLYWPDGRGGGYGVSTLLYMALELPQSHHQMVVVRHLLAAKANPDRGTPNGPPLVAAMSRKDVSLMGVLLEAGADPNGLMNDGGDGTQSLLHLAARSGSECVARLLIAHRAEVNAWNSRNLTPLGVACLASKFSVAEALLDHGASLTMHPDAHRQIPVILARRQRCRDAARTLCGVLWRRTTRFAAPGFPRGWPLPRELGTQIASGVWATRRNDAVWWWGKK